MHGFAPDRTPCHLLPMSDAPHRAALLGDRLTIAELTTALDCSQRFVYKLLSEGLPYVKIAGKRYISPADFQEMVAARARSFPKNKSPAPPISQQRLNLLRRKPQPARDGAD